MIKFDPANPYKCFKPLADYHSLPEKYIRLMEILVKRARVVHFNDIPFLTISLDGYEKHVLADGVRVTQTYISTMLKTMVDLHLLMHPGRGKYVLDPGIFGVRPWYERGECMIDSINYMYLKNDDFYGVCGVITYTDKDQYTAPYIFRFDDNECIVLSRKDIPATERAFPDGSIIDTIRKWTVLLQDLACGDTVLHSAFGEGLVVNRIVTGGTGYEDYIDQLTHHETITLQFKNGQKKKFGIPYAFMEGYLTLI